MKTTTEKQDVIAAWDYCKKDMIETLVDNKEMEKVSEVFGMALGDTLINGKEPAVIHHEAFMYGKKSEAIRVLLENSTTLNEFIWLYYSFNQLMNMAEQSPEMALLKMISGMGESLRR
jgi:hypothetical protein